MICVSRGPAFGPCGWPNASGGERMAAAPALEYFCNCAETNSRFVSPAAARSRATLAASAAGLRRARGPQCERAGRLTRDTRAQGGPARCQPSGSLRKESPPSGSLSHRPIQVSLVRAASASPCGLPQDRECRRMLFRARERSQVRDEQFDMLKRRLLVFLEIEAEPAGGEAAVAVRLLPRHECRQLERLGDRHAADLSRGHLGEHEVVVFQRPLKDRSRVALRGRRCSSPGPRRRSRLYGTGAGPPNVGARSDLRGSSVIDSFARIDEPGLGAFKPERPQTLSRLGRGGADAPARSAAVWPPLLAGQRR
jgi:hypothetical protein